MHFIQEELGRGIIKEETKQKYVVIANKLVNRRAEGIILGCTEIPMLISQADFSIPIFDSAKIHTF